MLHYSRDRRKSAQPSVIYGSNRSTLKPCVKTRRDKRSERSQSCGGAARSETNASGRLAASARRSSTAGGLAPADLAQPDAQVVQARGEVEEECVGVLGHERSVRLDCLAGGIQGELDGLGYWPQRCSFTARLGRACGDRRSDRYHWRSNGETRGTTTVRCAATAPPSVPGIPSPRDSPPPVPRPALQARPVHQFGAGLHRPKEQVAASSTSTPLSAVRPGLGRRVRRHPSSDRSAPAWCVRRESEPPRSCAAHVARHGLASGDLCAEFDSVP
jgi:hypothetical protein